jgi:transcriptional regulator with XRE-family HTH domain
MVSTLLHLRTEKGLSQQEIAEQMGCDPSKISRLETGTDFQLKWVDIIKYLHALGVRLNIMFQDDSLSAASQIKQHVFAIHELLQQLAALAEEVGDDEDLIDKIHQFYGEVLFNFVERFEDSYEKLLSGIQVENPSGQDTEGEKKFRQQKGTEKAAQRTDEVLCGD